MIYSPDAVIHAARGVPDHRDQIAVAAGLNPQNAEALLLIVVGDALYDARQHFLGRLCGPRQGALARRIGLRSRDAAGSAAAPAARCRNCRRVANASQVASDQGHISDGGSSQNPF